MLALRPFAGYAIASTKGKMYSNQEKNTVKRARIAVVAIALVLAVLFTAFAFIVYFSGKRDLPKAQIEANLAALTEDKGYGYACSYVTELGINSFDKLKLKRIESYYQGLYVGELPTAMELAKSTVSLYLEYFYDELTRKGDEGEITDALITCYVASTGDRYGFYRNETQSNQYGEDTSGEYVGIGITVFTEPDEDGNIVILSVGKDSPAREAGILPGDLIVSVEGRAVSEIGAEAASSAIRGESGTSVQIGIKRGEEILNLSVKRRLVTEESVSYSVLDGNVGLVTVTGFKGNTPEQFREAIDALEALGVRAIVFDMRNNPGGLLSAITEVLAYLVPTGTRVVSYVTADGAEQVLYAEEDEGGADHVLKIPCAVLCNGYTASAAELFTAALRDYNKMGLLDAITVGEKTFAKGIMQSTYTLPDKTTITLTIAFYNPPSGVNYDGKGVQPDFEKPEDMSDEELAKYAAELIFDPPIIKHPN